MRDVRDCIHRDTGISVENTVEQQRAAAASGHLVTPLSRQGVGTGGGEVGWLWDWERRVLGRQGVLPAMASLVSWHLWHQCCGITCGRTPRRVPVRHTPGAATAAPSSIEHLLNWRTRPPISATPCVMCVMAATRRSDARTEVTSEVTQHRNVMRIHAYVMRKRGVCRAVPYGFASWWVATGTDRGSGPARPPGHAAAFVCGPRGGCGVPDMPDRGTHTSTDSDCSTSTLDGGAVGRGVWGVGADARDGGRRERGPCTHDSRHRDQGFGRHGTSECDNVAVALGTLFAYCLL